MTKFEYALEISNKWKERGVPGEMLFDLGFLVGMTNEYALPTVGSADEMNSIFAELMDRVAAKVRPGDDGNAVLRKVWKTCEEMVKEKEKREGKQNV